MRKINYINHQKLINKSIFKGLFWYTYIENRSKWFKLTLEQVQEIIDLNKNGEKAISLEEYEADLVEETVADFENVVGQDSLTRFDAPKRNKRNKNKRRKKQAVGQNKPNPNQNKQKTRQPNQNPNQKKQGPGFKKPNPNQKNKPINPQQKTEGTGTVNQPNKKPNRNKKRRPV